MFLSNNVEEIKKHVKGEVPRVDGYHLLLKVYVGKDKTDGGIVLTDEIRETNVYRCIVGMVLAKGPKAFEKIDSNGNKYFDEWLKCEVGDWVIFKPNAGCSFKYCEVPMRFVPDDQILATVTHPQYVMRD